LMLMLPGNTRSPRKVKSNQLIQRDLLGQNHRHGS
jgi:hypothetical protein